MVDNRAVLAQRALEGYVHGPDANLASTVLALEKAQGCEAAILVEGISDQIAVETLARALGRELEAEGIAVVPIGGAHAVAHYLRRLGPLGDGLALAGLCDDDAVDVFSAALTRAGAGPVETVEQMEAVGFFVCSPDLEHELIRSVGVDEVEAVLASQGELASFRTFQKQPHWRGQPAEDQLRRFIGVKARRSLRYARLLVEAVGVERAPAPLRGVVDFF